MFQIDFDKGMHLAFSGGQCFLWSVVIQYNDSFWISEVIYLAQVAAKYKYYYALLANYTERHKSLENIVISPHGTLIPDKTSFLIMSYTQVVVAQ